MSLSVLVGTANGISRVCLPLFAASLHAAAWQIGIVGGLQYAGMLLLSMPLGALIDRHGSWPLFRIGATAAAAVFLFGLTQARGWAKSAATCSPSCCCSRMRRC